MSAGSRFQFLSDEELFDLLGKTGAAEDEFYRRYKKRVKWLIRRYQLNSLEREDMIQEGMIGLFSALASYDKNRGIKFSTYATVCIRNRLNSAIQSLWRQKKKLDNNQDVEEILTKSNPEEDIMMREFSLEVKQAVLELASLEKQILEKYLDKKSYQQIAKELEISTKKVDNILMKIKAKLARKLNDLPVGLAREKWGNDLKNSIEKGLDNET